MQRRNDVRYKSKPIICQMRLSPRAYAELKKGWAGYFRSDVIPLIKEDHCCGWQSKEANSGINHETYIQGDGRIYDAKYKN